MTDPDQFARNQAVTVPGYKLARWLKGNLEKRRNRVAIGRQISREPARDHKTLPAVTGGKGLRTVT